MEAHRGRPGKMRRDEKECEGMLTLYLIKEEWIMILIVFVREW